ncbi:14946_t:CDS:10 [Cetraspora pellucida]|uniref:14946_t:CDS:1 n=1 Tax=Cetraspora pellucida TaxID=1433469 RepID=A0A9N9B2Q7_9GLOM|nr:14946_t:CDS:10 [Cetraspora pellucida]
MSEILAHKYFDKKSSEWNILGFLDECEEEKFDLKIDQYVKSLEKIANEEKDSRREKAQKLLDSYKKASGFLGCLTFKIPPGRRWLSRLPVVQRFLADLGIRLDYHLARAWEKGQSKRQIQCYQQTFLEGGTINGSVNGNITCGNFTGSSNKRGEEEVDNPKEEKVLRKNLQNAGDRQIIPLPRTPENQDLDQNHDDRVDDENVNFILQFCVPDDDSQKVAESMIGKVERTALIIDDVNLEETFECYCNECENIFDDIMDLRPGSKFTEKISEAIWENFISNTYPEYKLPKKWEEIINEVFKPKDSLLEWIKCWRGLYVISGENECDEDLYIKDTIYNILAPYIKAFKAPYNILKSGDLEENQFNAQFVNPIFNNTLDAICNVDWRILEVPIESSKHRRNTNLNPIIDKVLSAKRADGLARLWISREEVFIYEQVGPPDYNDLTELYLHDYKLIRTMRDILNQRIIFRLTDGTSDNKDLASFGALGYRTDVSLFWLTINQKAYCVREFGSFRVPLLWEDLPSFVKENTEKRKLFIDPKQKLLAKRKVHTITPNPPTPDRSKKQNCQPKKQKK